ncbi:glutamate 5-kinase [Puniceicoccaceae bacterium K14]|nr:glutamate 5-kinase [Puniceicoccaceae bacterium K14]
MDKKIKRIVIKLGTGILTTGIGIVDTERINALCHQIAEVRKRDIEVLIVSSGAVGMGMGAMNLNHRPNTLIKKQACAAIGQSRLIQCWQEGFNPHDLIVGQILLTHEGLRIRNRYVNAKATIDQMLAYGVLPIINENDSISTFEIKFGNNDVLGAMVSSLTESDHLLILSTAPGLIDMDGSGEIITDVEEITPAVEALAKDTSSPTAVGGMVTKIEAAKIATKSGCETYIADGNKPNIILDILNDDYIGTRFHANQNPMVSKKRWLAYFQRPQGSITIDEGAVNAIMMKESSLLAPGIVASEGEYLHSDIVDIKGENGEIIARGECKFSSHEVEMIANNKYQKLEELYPDRKQIEVVHRDFLVLL